MIFEPRHTLQTLSRSFFSPVRMMFVLVCLVSNSMVFAATASLAIKAETEVRAERVLLGDLMVENPAAASTQLPMDLDIMAAPRPGTVKSVAGRKLAESIKALPDFPKGASVTAPEIVRVRRAGQAVSEERLKELLIANLGSGDQVVRRVTVRGNKDFPLGALTLRISECKADKKNRRVDAVAEVLVDGKPVGRLNVSGLVDQYAEVVCLGRSLEAGAVLQAADLTRKRVNISMLSNHVLFALEEAVGKELKKGLRAGAFLERKYLMNPILVQKGDQVKLIVKNGPLSIAITGVAKSSGGVSDQVRVENTASNRVVTGQVVDAATVEIVF